MTHHGRFALLAGMGVCAASLFIPDARADELAELKARLEKIEQDNQQLRDKVTRLEAGNDENWLNGRRAEEVRALIHEVLADADTRASLLSESMTAGYTNGIFFLGSGDGKYLLQIGGLIQARYIYNHRGGSPGAHEQHDDNEAGFDLARVRLEVSGYIGDPRFTYAIRFGPDREDNEVLGEKAVIGYHPTKDFSFYAGEDKAGFLREETTSAAMQLAVERSLMNEVFTVGYIQGIWMTWQVNDDLNFYASFNDGVRSGEADNEFNSAFILFPPTDGDLEPIHKPFFLDHSDFAATFRVDWKLAGNWKQYEDFSSWSGEPLAIFLGAAVHLEVGETGSGTGADGKTGTNDNFLLWTVDGSIEKDGFNLFASVAGLHTDLESGDDLNMYGAVIQGGYMVIPDKLEPFARVEWIGLDGRNTTGKNDLVIVTLGANYFIHRHTAKFTADVMWVVNDMPPSRVVGTQDDIDGYDQGLGHLGLREANGNNQWVVRLQFQLMF